MIHTHGGKVVGKTACQVMLKLVRTEVFGGGCSFFPTERMYNLCLQSQHRNTFCLFALKETKIPASKRVSQKNVVKTHKMFFLYGCQSSRSVSCFELSFLQLQNSPGRADNANLDCFYFSQGH